MPPSNEDLRVPGITPGAPVAPWAPAPGAASGTTPSATAWGEAAGVADPQVHPDPSATPAPTGDAVPQEPPPDAPAPVSATPEREVSWY